MQDNVELRRTLSLPMMVLYGLGTTIGAGIYALVGEVANEAGYFAPVSFLFASFIAGCAALSFAELCGRYPKAAGVALYVRHGFGSERLSTIVGLLVITAGLVSSAALINGFVGYLHQFIVIDRFVAILLVAIVLGGISVWGIAESVTVASVITVIEIGGLLLIVTVSGEGLATFTDRWDELIPPIDIASWSGIYVGTVLAFYAFIGFEDMVDVAEEVQDVKRTLPIAIVLTLGITTIFYLLIMVTAVLSLTPEELAASDAPLAYLYEINTGKKPVVISFIAMFAIINGALIQVIMASRVLYGLGSRGQLPRILARVHPRTRTPLIATAVATGIVLILALTGSLASLAGTTSFVVLIIFSFVTLALWRIKRRDPRPAGVRVFPVWVPIIGFFLSLGFVLIELATLIDM